MIRVMDIIDEALAVYGIENQVRMYMEEAAELTVELNKMLRGRTDNAHGIAEEIADVQIMLAQLTRYYLISEEVEKVRNAKYARLAKRLGFEEEGAVRLPAE